MNRMTVACWLVLAGCASGPTSAADTTAAATAACRADCAQQQRGCASLDVDGCHGLCDYAVATLKPGACTTAQTSLWQCEALALWRCSTATDIVGEPVDSAACATATAARDAACSGG